MNNQNQQENQQYQDMGNHQTEKQRKDRQLMLTIIGVAVLVVGLVGITYAFFNYTRTGTANTIQTGRINFNAEQSGTVTLSDLFPITTDGNVTASTPGVGSLSIRVTGGTTYSGGVEYIVKAVNVTGNNGTSLPISINVGYEANTDKTIGSANDNYFTSRGGSTSMYKVLSNDTITEGQDLVVGYIAPNTEIDGNIVIMAYLDANNIAITDTYPEATHYGVNDSMTSEEATACAGLFATGYTFDNSGTAADFCAGTGTVGGKNFQTHLDEGLFSNTLLEDLVEANAIHEEYYDGTTSTWVRGRTVFTTSEWNALQSSGVSFQVRVEANEGVWVPNPTQQP